MTASISSARSSGNISALFVCTGNICRSPMAEAVFADLVRKNGLSSSFGAIESCGTTGYHVGDEADDRYVRLTEGEIERGYFRCEN